MTWPLRISFVVPGPPVPWQRAGTTRSGRHYTPERSKEHRAAIQKFAMVAAYRQPEWNAGATSYKLTLRFFLPDSRARDWDNLGKQVSDALNKLLYEDDRRIDEVSISKRIDRARPRSAVELEVLG